MRVGQCIERKSWTIPFVLSLSKDCFSLHGRNRIGQCFDKLSTNGIFLGGVVRI